jgi:diguanylate cyclase (GGDEF)-like protein
LSFKYRLRTFFFLLTVLPLLAAGYAVQEVFRANRASRVDASLASTLQSALSFYGDRRDLALQVLNNTANDGAVQAAIQSTNNQDLTSALAVRTLEPFSITFYRNNQPVAGQPPLTGSAFLAKRDMVTADGVPAGTLVVGFPMDASVAEALSTNDVAVGFLNRQQVTTQNGTAGARLPLTHGETAFDGTVGGQKVRMLERSLTDSSPATEVVALYPRARLDAATSDVRKKVAIVIGVVLVLVLILAELVVRSITGQIAVFARRATEVGEGKFAGDLPVHGNDEFAQFAHAFNSMAHELQQRIDELESERRRVQEAVSRFGQALESTHDVSKLLQIVIESAMEAVGARGGRVVIVDEQTGSLVEHRRLGSAVEATEATLPARVVLGEGVEGLAAHTGRPALQNEPVAVLSVPLQTAQAVIGLLTLIDPRRGSFEEEDGGTLQALASQGAIAIENARMHRLITKQASTDGLTGLANHREFQDQLRREVERAQRFNLPLSLMLLDLDDFKLINDRFGHLTGDSVLRVLSQILKGAIREIDCAARYGGEEFAIILPGTTAEGAARLGERVRMAIAERPVRHGEDRVVSVTASFGIATMPNDGSTQVELVAAADAALYQAKRAGKNRIVIASATADHQS